MSKAQSTFWIGVENTEGSQKYTSETATVNGTKGRIWTKRVCTGSGLVHDGKQFVRAAADETEVTAAFE